MCLLYHITENVRKYKMIKKLDFSVSRKIFTHTTVKLGNLLLVMVLKIWMKSMIQQLFQEWVQIQ